VIFETPAIALVEISLGASIVTETSNALARARDLMRDVFASA
jgi:hypothetical protein